MSRILNQKAPVFTCLLVCFCFLHGSPIPAQQPVKTDTLNPVPVDEGAVTRERIRTLLDSLRSNARGDTIRLRTLTPSEGKTISPGVITRGKIGGQPRITSDTPYRAELMQAESFLSVQKYEEAVKLVEPIFFRNPDLVLIAESLKKGLRGLKDYPRLRGVIRLQLDLDPLDPALHVELTDTWLKEGKLDSARQSIDQLLSLPIEGPILYADAADVYLRNGRYNEATDVYLQARTDLNDPYAFAERLASIYTGWRKYGLAIQEYYHQLQDNPKAQARVEQNIEELIRQGEAIDDIGTAIEELVRANPHDPFAHRLHADLLFETDRYAESLAEYRAADSLSESSLDNLLLFITKAIETERYSVAQDAINWYYHSGTRHPREFELAYLHADCYVGLGKPDSAVIIYRDLMQMVPREELKAEIAGRIAQVFFDANEIDSALVYYQKVLASKTRPSYVTAALFGMGECEMVKGHLAAADSSFWAAGETRPGPDLAELIAFRRAEVLFLSEDFDSCAIALKDLVAKNPRGFYVNDAINLSLLLKENRDDLDWSLKRFVHGRLMSTMRMHDSARAAFQVLVEDSSSSLADDAMLELAHLDAKTEQWQKAVQSYHSLTQRYPASFLAPLAWIELGDLLAQKMAQPAEAIAAYNTVLEQYKNTPHAETVRRKLQKLGQP